MVKNIFKRLLNIKTLFCLILLLNLSVVLHVFQGKQAFHSDEQWSYAHANSSKGAFLDVEIDSYLKVNDNIRQRLFDHYINSSVLHNYLTVQQGERFTYRHIYENLKKDVHPPLYFLILHTVCSFFPDRFDKWYAGSINIVLFILCYIALFKLSKLILNDSRLAICSVALWGFSEIGLDTVVFLRMYILQTLLSICLMYEAIKIVKENKVSGKQLFLTFLYSFLGIFTQYNSIFFSFFVALIVCLIMLKRKNYRLMFWFGGFMALSVIMLFIVFPPASDVLLGSVRGRQVMSGVMHWGGDEKNYMMEFLFRAERSFSVLGEILFMHFFAFDAINGKVLSFVCIMLIASCIYLKVKISPSVALLLSVLALYTIYLFSMPYMHIFHSRYYMNIMPFFAIITVLAVNKLLTTAGVSQKIKIAMIAILVFVNALCLNFSDKSAYAFEYGMPEKTIAAHIKDNDVFINAGDRFIWLHSMVHYLAPAKRVYITEDICNSQTLAHIVEAEMPVVLTYSSYIKSSPDNQSIDCLKRIGLTYVTTICASQHCYNVWEKTTQKI
ncbi:MAG: hypothetical protein J6C85_01350 [Alphaproteobacteria bacterium]|nr:hypothetical protein [Alphaproteobacteria bacterium]